MTYSTPTLLLVGAAQNLVLNTCGFLSDVGTFSNSCRGDGENYIDDVNAF
jgi:hypothetical protein